MGIASFTQTFGTSAIIPNICDSLATDVERRVLPKDVQTWIRFRLNLKDASAHTLVVQGTREMSDFTVNGQPVAMDPDSTWLDCNFRKVDLRGPLRAGANEIQYRLHWVNPLEKGTVRMTPGGHRTRPMFSARRFQRGMERQKPGEPGVGGLVADRPCGRPRAAQPALLRRTRALRNDSTS